MEITDTASNTTSRPRPERILREAGVLDRVGLSRSTLWRMEKAGRFPPRVRIGAAGIGWSESEVDRWIRDRKRA